MQTVIVRYEGALAQSVEREIPGATTVELFNEYGVVTIPDGQLETRPSGGRIYRAAKTSLF